MRIRCALVALVVCAWLSSASIAGARVAPPDPNLGVLNQGSRTLNFDNGWRFKLVNTSDTSDPFSLPAGQKFADDFHLYAVEWEPGVVRFYVDANLYATVTQSQWPAGGAWVFDHPFFIILNVAVGGNWPGSPDNTTVFPQQMLVDYVRVYTKK